MSTVWEILAQKLPRDVVKYCIKPFVEISEAQVRKHHKWCMAQLMSIHEADNPEHWSVKEMLYLIQDEDAFDEECFNTTTFFQGWGPKTNFIKVKEQITGQCRGRRESERVFDRILKALKPTLDKRNSGLE